MKRAMLFISLVAVLALSMLACSLVTINPTGREVVRGSGDIISEARPVRGVKAVQLRTLGTLHIEFGDQEKLVVEAEDNVLPYIETEVRDGTLSIRISGTRSLQNIAPIHYYLTVKEINELSTYSSGDIECAAVESDDFRVQVSSSGDIDLESVTAGALSVQISSSGDVNIGRLEANRLEAFLSSSGDLKIEDGAVQRQEIQITSSGNYDGRGLESQTAEARISSSGDATLRVAERLEANLSSSGNLYYLGDPEVDASTSSTGDIEKLSE